MLTLRSRVAEGAGDQSGRRRRLPTKARKKPPRNPIMKHSGMPQSNRSPNIKSMASLTAMHIRSIAILLERRVNIRPEANAPMPDTAIITYIIQFSILYQQPPQQIYPDRPDKKRVKLNGFDFRGLKQKIMVGYLFLFIDFNDPDKPLIHIRTWQPERNPELTPNLPPDHPRAGIFSPACF